jgi:UDP-glucose 4-epimerase
MMRVIVTGAAGYIGGEIVLKLKQAGHYVVGIDWRSCPEHLQSYFDYFITKDFSTPEVLEFISNSGADIVVHCAGASLVGPSMINPKYYYHNNVFNTLKLLDVMIKNMPNTRIIFSSSAAVYGTPVMVPCSEVDPCEPINPYGESKLMIEWMLNGYHRAYKLDYVAFRYFNAAGADSQARHGPAAGDTHIISRVLESVKNVSDFALYGNDYPTPDGTCIRDYVHVEDIADAHILALEKSVPAGVYNIGNNKGTSNLEIINEASNITGVKFPVIVKEKRRGDPSTLTAESNKFQTATGWSPKYTLQDIITHAWAWHCK